MKKRFFFPMLASAAILAGSLYISAKDPILMTVNKKEVPLSEFLYIYQKNNKQQQQPQTVDEYLDMFVTYKLKVADAEAAGIDTTAAFRKELSGYTRELAEPYMRDNTVEQRLIEEAYGRMKRNVNVSHIMLSMGNTPQEKESARTRLDSIRTAILNGADFAEMARKYSTDRSAETNGGNLGFIVANAYPYSFEKASFNTPVGKVSEVFEDVPFNCFHIVRVEGERPDAGEVHAAHILKLTRDLSNDEKESKKAAIDSIYNVLKAGGDFTETARKESEDGSKSRGGDLGWFGAGRMVPEFEKVAFELKDGEVSAPFESRFGYHIIKRLGHRDVGTLEETTPLIKRAISQDERAEMPTNARLEQFKAQYKANILPKGLQQVDKFMRQHGGCDSACVASLAGSAIKVATVGKRTLTVADVLKGHLQDIPTKGDLDKSMEAFKRLVGNALDRATIEEARERLLQDNEEYRNLVNEYRDGILLFDISNRNVWERSTKDKDGLEQYFEANRGRYTWDKPHYKGYVIFAVNDSIGDVARKYLDSHQISPDSLNIELRRNFGREVKVERVVVGKGDNPIIDNIAFGGEKPSKDKSRWNTHFGYKGRIINAPEEALDVKGAVSTDYQAYLEKEWVKELKSKYPVKINEKVRKMVK